MALYGRFGGAFSTNKKQVRNQNNSNNFPGMMHDDSFGEQFQYRVFLRELLPGVLNKKVIGLVISKYEARSFPDKKNAGQLRYNQLFTLRDTADDFINVICWGGETFIENITHGFRTGDIVEIDNCMVQSKQNNEYEEIYRPSTPTPFQLVVNESHSTVIQFTGSDFSEFSSIAYIPVKDSNDYYTLGDVIANGNNLHGRFINILAVVRDPGKTKDITTKTGKQMKRREIKLFDESCLSFPMLMWDGELAEQADSWTPREAVLFLCDIKVTYDDFRRKMISTCTSKTIIITNPDTPEAHHLYSYAQTVNVNDDGYAVDGENQEIDLSIIQDVYNLNQLEEKLDSFTTDSILPMPFYGIIYGCISNFDIDVDEGKRCIITRCKHCKRRVDRNSGKCINTTCLGAEQFDNEANSTMRSLEIRLSLSDHTNGIDGFVMSRDVVEKVLNYNVESFNSLDTNSKTDLKWKFLFERFKVYFKAIPATQDYQRPFLNVLSLDQVDVGEMIRCGA